MPIVQVVHKDINLTAVSGDMQNVEVFVSQTIKTLMLVQELVRLVKTLLTTQERSVVAPMDKIIILIVDVHAVSKKGENNIKGNLVWQQARFPFMPKV